MMNVALKKGNSAESKTIVNATDMLFPTGSATVNTMPLKSRLMRFGDCICSALAIRLKPEYRKYWEML
jgi:hypothetical protein